MKLKLPTMLVAGLLVLAACGSGSQAGNTGGGSQAGNTGGGSQAGNPGKNGKYTIALSNSYIGNKWRVEMVNDFKSTCASPPWNKEVDCSVFNAGNDVSSQSQQISNLISKHVDAIVMDAASPTGLNGVIKQACDRGILMISFDSVVTAPCAVTVDTDNTAFGKQLAQFVADKIHGKGNVIMVTGVAGTAVTEQRQKGAQEVWDKNPGIKIVAKYPGNWDSATAQRNTAAQLPSMPKVVDGIWAEGGTDGILKAFIDANRPLPPTAGEAENGFRKFMSKEGYLGHHVDGLSIGEPPYLSVAALQLALDILKGNRPKAGLHLPFPVVTNATIEVGKTVFPKLEDSFFVSFTDSGPNAVVTICEQAALTGAVCPTPPKVNLPK